MEKIYNNIIILNSEVCMQNKIKMYLSEIGITEKYVCNRENKKYTIIYFNEILKIIAFELVDHEKIDISIEVYKNVNVKYYETLYYDYSTSSIEFEFNNNKIIIKAEENDKAIELKKMI